MINPENVKPEPEPVSDQDEAKKGKSVVFTRNTRLLNLLTKYIPGVEIIVLGLESEVDKPSALQGPKNNKNTW